MTASIRLCMIVALLPIVLSACSDEQKSSAPEGKETAVELRVMSFNIEYGGTHVSFDKVVEAIEEADADIVGIQEAEGNLQQLAARLGWNYDLRNYVISRFPLINPSGADGRYVYIEIEPGRVVALANIHLPSDPYGPYAIADGATDSEVLELERGTRLSKMEPYLKTLAPLVKSNIPLFITGDFNSPSHLDLKRNAIATPTHPAYMIEWPVSLAIANAGFKDSWRTIYPDAVANPGLTWWAGRPSLAVYEIDKNEPQDRIDFIWFAGAAVVQSSEIAGENFGPEVSIPVDPWPSDHRAVVSQFLAHPVALPSMVSTNCRICPSGEDVDVRYVAGNQPARLIVINDNLEASVKLEQEVSGSGHWLIASNQLEPGHYRVQLEFSEAGTMLKNEFWIAIRNAAPALTVNKERFSSGEPIQIEWQDAPGNRNDYVAIYPSDITPDYDSEPAWSYINALPSGKLQLDNQTSEAGWPLAPGTYIARMMKDDGIEQLAESFIFVVEN